MAASLMLTHFAPPHNAYARHTQLPQPPPSPPMEDARCSLPSISKLLGLADAGSPINEASPTSQMESPRTEATGSSALQCRQEASFSTGGRRPDSGYATSSHQQRGLPLTPPMMADASFDGYNSSLSKPFSQAASVSGALPGRPYETTPPLDDFRRHHMAPSTTPRHPLRHSFSGPFPGPQAVGGAYYHSPMAAPASSHPQISNLFYQQSLPQAFPPLSVPMVVAPSSGANPWQHHHYLAPSQGAGYPQNQDRYICQTCNKAFSRPSSLRIHSHSHTGEKPFKCPHAGCGKAFSVRSNMKRHERGCHSFDSGRRSSHAT